MSDCPENKEDIVAKPSDNYRYFNQPIEQIPGWEPDNVQILLHAAGCGLKWHTVECLDVVTCIKLGSSELTVDQRKAVIIKDLEVTTPTCSGIPTTECSGTSSPSQFDAYPSFIMQPEDNPNKIFKIV